MWRSLFSRRTRNVLGAVVLGLAIVAAALMLPQIVRRANDARLQTKAAGLATRAAEADAAGLLLRTAPDRFAGELSPALLSVLQKERERYEALVERGELALSVIEVGDPERQDVDPGEGKVLYRVPLLVNVAAHPTMAPGRYWAHATVLLQAHGGGWQVSQLHTVLEEEAVP